MPDAVTGLLLPTEPFSDTGPGPVFSDRVLSERWPGDGKIKRVEQVGPGGLAQAMSHAGQAYQEVKHQFHGRNRTEAADAVVLWD